MNTWRAKSFLFSSLVDGVTMDVDLTASNYRTQYGYLFTGLKTGFYPGGGSDMQQIYELLVEAAQVHGIWVRRSCAWPWQVHIVGSEPVRLRNELWRRYQADCVACKLAEADQANKTGDYWFQCKPSASFYYANTRTLQDKHWLKDLSAKYVDDNYRRRIEPFIKRVENGRLVVRRTNGKWSIG